MESFATALVFLVVVAALWIAAVYFPLRAAVDAAEELDHKSGRPKPLSPQVAALWADYEHIGQVVVEAADFREAGWSSARTASFFELHFPGRDRVSVEELRRHMGDVMVRDLMSYRSARAAAARRYHAIRFTWINVDDAEKKGLIPPEMRRLVCERERQSGLLIWASDLIPFVGRPFVRELLERKLAESGVKPAA
jgi:hypothetical protein